MPKSSVRMQFHLPVLARAERLEATCRATPAGRIESVKIIGASSKKIVSSCHILYGAGVSIIEQGES